MTSWCFPWACLLVLLALPAIATERSCEDLARAAESRYGVPPGLLQAVALTESGRYDSELGRAVSWPWAIASGNEYSAFAPDKLSALSTVQQLQREGRRNIDVGCMQINLLHHPDAFPTLESAFDPASNVDYGARFLTALWRETGSWEDAVARYHSANSGLGQTYRDQVLQRWHRLPLGPAPSPITDAALPVLVRPRPPGTPGSVFAWLAPSVRLTPARSGQSLWATRPAVPLLVRGQPLGTLVTSGG